MPRKSRLEEPTQSDCVIPHPTVRGTRALIQRLFYVLAGGLLAAGAAPASAHQSGTTLVRDSAGVSVVTVPASAADRVTLRVAGNPAAVIGAREDDWRHALLNVSAAVRGRDGTIVVANTGGPDLRFYDARGNFLRAVGRLGEGPGEFGREGYSLVYAMDSLVTFDSRLGRLQIFDLDGTFRRTVRVGTDSFPRNAEGRRAGMSQAGAFEDGSLLVRMVRTSRSTPARDTSRYFRVGRDGRVMYQIGTFVGGPIQEFVESTERLADGIFRIGTIQKVTRAVVNRPDYVVVSGSSVYYMDDSANEVKVYSNQGALTRRIRLPGTPLFSRPPAKPASNNAGASLGFLVDDTGRIWVEQYRLPTDPQPRWLVLTPAGAPVGIALTPPKLFILSVGGDHLLGVRHDADGVESVESHALISTRDQAPRTE